MEISYRPNIIIFTEFPEATNIRWHWRH